MRKIIYWVHTSIDGHIDGPQGEFDWPEMGDELSAYSEALIDRVDTFLYGRGVWEGMASFWPAAESLSDHPHVLKFAPVWRNTPKIVFSTTLKEDGWAARIIGENLAAEVSELKRQPGKDLLLTGGSRLAAALTDHGLIDEYHVAAHPVVLGGGKPLFVPREDRIKLRLVASRTCDSRVVVTRYDRAHG
ncbi:dihydrofolate reductase family protein [Nonomuraea sp. NEAU-A123]|uniref:dihydrofolate reductase family protein n=1 Tax=Nonomuraea sp. NEAU-A123 TaxID=2839649 RepID=UPI001BE44AC2|nr:dihydrofolate reductase family protein [Nonomuraea sp. NEAU-A123]MBT2229802.1 dihydrofolate reductase family protein [Nonomuraea sp. NEAU-A123]